MNLHSEFSRGFAKPVCIGCIIFVRAKADLAIITALNYMLRHPWWAQTGSPWHGFILETAGSDGNYFSECGTRSDY